MLKCETSTGFKGRGAEVQRTDYAAKSVIKILGSYMENN